MKQRFTTADSPPTAGTKAVDRALALLTAFGERDAWTLTELAQAQALHKTTTLRLLGALGRAELVTRDDVAHVYRLGPGLLTLAMRALRAMDLYHAAHPELVDLAARTGETATLEILVGLDTLILDEVKGSHLVGSAPEIGTRWPAHATSTGKVLLAAAEDEHVRLPRRRRFERLTPRTIASAARLARELEVVRRRGYSVARGEAERGFTAIGAAIRNHERRVVAAISAGGPSTRLTTARIARVAEQVRLAASRVSRRLGAAEPLLSSPSTA